jgi:D-3-phosphoglycerate dehydrogenase / 2-oxoglutarate reductase
MTNYSIHITDSDFSDIQIETQELALIGATLQRHDCRSAEEVIINCQDADALIVQWVSINRDVFEKLPYLKAIARLGIGVDMIDLTAATEAGVAVCNTPTYCIEEVATHALSMILTLNRRLLQFNAAMNSRQWGI